MGVPAFFRWLSRKYPAIISNANEERPVEVNGVKVPVDCTKPNPNFQEFDNLYLDMNGIIHPCTHPEDRPAPRNEDEMFALIFEYIDRMFAIVRPRRLLYMAIDGVAPRAKMNQQRSRRFRSSKEAAEKEEQIRKVRERLEADGCPLPPEKKEEEKFDSNCITPGTPFMARLADALRYYIHNRITNDAAWAKIEVILSDANVPGEGEHKIMDYIRRQRASPNHDPNTVHCLCGADADLIMLGLATHEANFNIIREEFVPNQPRPCELCGQYGHELNDCQGLATEEVAAHQSDPLDKTTNFVFIRLPVLREYLEKDLAMPNLPFPFDLERVLDDWVFMCFFVGNDFLPHLPSLEIREGAIDRLIKLYKDVCVLSNGYLTENGNVNIDRAQRILNGLGDVEDQIFQERQRREVRFRENRKRQRRSAPAYIPTKGLLAPLSAPQAMTGEQTRELARDARVEAMQYSNAQETQQRLGAILQPAGTAAAGNDRKRKATEDLDSEEEEPYDEVRLYEEGWRERYYASKFDVAASDVDFRRQVAEAYMEGLCWVLRYYYQGCGSWDWFYPYHYAPFASDFDRIYDFKPDFTKPTKPFKPLEQLMCVFPAASRKHIPEPWHYLMTDTESPIIDFYPNDFQIDLNGKKFAWQGVALLPFVDEDRLLGTLSEVQDKLSDEEKHRNSLGPSRVFLGTQHPAYQFFAEIYNHEGEVPVDLDSKLLYGMGGTIQKDNLVVLPGNAYGSAVSHETCQDIATNACISAIYADPFFGPEFVFPAVRLPGCAELQKTLKPENWNDRRDGQYRPQIGFNRDAPRASLDPGAMRGFRNEVHNRSYHNDRRDYSNDRNNRHSFPSARGYQGGWVPPGGHHRGGFHAHGGQHHQRGGHGHGGHHRDDRRNGRDWDQQRGGGRGGRGRPYRGKLTMAGEKKYGGCEGPDAEYVKLVSSDDHEFYIKRELAITSGTIKAMLSGPGQYEENESNVVHFREIPSHVLHKVCQYFSYKHRYTNSSTEIPEFNIQPEVSLELLMAANFLDC